MTAITFDAGNRGAPAAAVSAAISPNVRGMLDAFAGAPAARHASFAPLDPNILNESLPAFFIGRNTDGFWVARERQGRIGGIFFLKSSALSFAHRHAGDAACATIFPSDAFELDIKNNGNRLVDCVAPLMRRGARLFRQISRRMHVSQAV